MENLHQKLEAELHHKHSKEFSAGQVIFKEGDKIEEGIYYVLNGEVEIFKDENYLVKIAQGNFGGLCDGLLLDKRMETARAGSGGVRIVFFSEALFEKLLHLNHQFGFLLMMKAINMLENAQIKMIHYSVGHLLPGKFEESVFRKMDFLRKANKKIPTQLYNLRERHIKPGEYIFHENEEEGQNSYMVLAGNFQIRKTVRGHTLPLLDLFPGDLLTFFPGIRKIRLGFDLCAQTNTEGSLVLLDRELFLNLARANHVLFNSLFESILLNLYVRLTILT